MLFLCSFLFYLGSAKGIENDNMNPSKSFSHVTKEDYKERTNGEIQGCVMINRYDESPTTLVVTCRGDDDGSKGVDSAGIVFYDVTKDDQPKYIKHWKSPSASVEGQDSIDDTLVVVGFDGKLLTFDKWTQKMSNDGPLTPTAELQTSSRSLLHVKTFKSADNRKYAFISTGFSFNGVDKKTCEIVGDENDYHCGVSSLATELEAKGEKVEHAAEDSFDGVVIVDITDPANPTEISKVCLKVKCPEGTSIFFDVDGKPYGTVGGVNSEYMAVIDLSDPHNPVIVAQEHKSHLNQLVPLYGIHPALGPNGLYEAYANWGLIDGGITVWNFTTPSRPQEAAYLDSSDCSNSNRAIFWNERYLLTPLEGVAYGGVCVFDLCEVNKPKFRAYMHFEHFGLESASMPRTVYGMNAYKDHAYFAIYNRDFLQTYKINLDKIYNHVTDDNSDMKLFESESVYLKGFNATTCNVGKETNEKGRFLNTNEIYMVVAGTSVLLILVCVCLICVYCTQENGMMKSADEKYLDKMWTSKGAVKQNIDLVI